MEQEQKTEEYLTVKQVASQLGVSRYTIEKLIASKQLRAKKIGRVYRIRQQWLDAYMNDDTDNVPGESQIL